MKKNNFLFLLILVFIFIASSALALSDQGLKIALIRKPVEKSFTPIPVLVKEADFPIISAQAALAVDINSGITLYEKDPDKLLLPASTTKIITALVALDVFEDNDIVEVGKITVVGQKMGLKKGERITFLNLLRGLLIYSANDAAEAIAASYPGGREAFIAAMNKKARELHLSKSRFSNPTGLDGYGNDIVATARDLVTVSEVAMDNPKFAEIVRTEEITVKSTDEKISHHLTNINELIGKVPGVLGVKTGWTENARENLVSYIERDNHKILIAVLGSQDRFGETEELIDWIFGNYIWKEVKMNYSPR